MPSINNTYTISISLIACNIMEVKATMYTFTLFFSKNAPNKRKITCTEARAETTGPSELKKPNAETIAAKAAGNGPKNIARISGTCDAKVALNGKITTLIGTKSGIIIAIADKSAVTTITLVLVFIISWTFLLKKYNLY
ncbi:MAG: hypothetical protein GX800_12010 [Clostridiaceae bacterium]|nr:hypothetical protein [Clostridiaceae bacterium]